MLNFLSSETFCRFRHQESVPRKHYSYKAERQKLSQVDGIYKHHWPVYFKTKVYIFLIPLAHRTLKKLKAFFGLFPWKHPSLARFNILQELCLGIYFSNFKKDIFTKLWDGNHVKLSLWISASCIIMSRMRKKCVSFNSSICHRDVWPMIFHEKVYFQSTLVIYQCIECDNWPPTDQAHRRCIPESLKLRILSFISFFFLLF